MGKRKIIKCIMIMLCISVLGIGGLINLACKDINRCFDNEISVIYASNTDGVSAYVDSVPIIYCRQCSYSQIVDDSFFQCIKEQCENAMQRYKVFLLIFIREKIPSIVSSVSDSMAKEISVAIDAKYLQDFVNSYYLCPHCGKQDWFYVTPYMVDIVDEFSEQNNQ